MSSRAKPAQQPARPAGRYFKGKAPTNENVDSDSDEDDQHEDDELEPKQEDVGGDLLVPAASRGTAGKAMNVSLGKMGVTKDGKVTGAKAEESSSEEEESSEEEDVKPKFRAPVRPGQPAPAADEGSSSDYETDSEEDEPAKPALRPTFVPKRARETLMARDAATLSEEAAQAKLEADEEQRKKDSHDMVAESIRREIAEKEAPALITEVDDTDNLDPTAEFESWRLRELQRLARDEAAASAREEERDEVERRRAMPEEQRMREDMERAEQGRREKPKGNQVFLQKFWHKGAFHQDDEILQRDYSAPLESTVDVSSLPKVMQKRNFGKMSQSKYTHLVDQDTTGKGFGGPRGPGGASGQGCFNCGGDHMKKDCPQNPWNNQAGGSGGPAVTGSNNSALGAGPSRSWGVGSQQPPMPSGPSFRQEGSSSSSYPSRRDDQRDDRERDRRAEGWGRNEDVRRRRRSRSRERGGGGGGRWDDRRGGGRDERDRYGERDRDGGRRRSRSRSRSRERRPREEEKRRRVD